MQSYVHLLASVPIYQVFRKLGKPQIFPINYTFSVTNVCPSRCKTCFIWKLYREKPELKKHELSTSEWARIIESIDKSPFWVTISGGEPFVRNDLVEISKMICEVNKPKIINIPTNGLLCDRIKSVSPKILEVCDENNVLLIVNLSIDGIGKDHDNIRGVRGNWDNSIKSLSVLRKLKRENPNMLVGIHTVISRYNIQDLLEIVKYIIEKMKPDHYVMEVAEERSELLNKGANITPSLPELKRTLNEVSNYLNSRQSQKAVLEKISQAFRFRYYDLIPKILDERRQIIPCMSSFASCQITPFGDLWACCILGYEKSIGNLRNVGFNFQRLWKSKKAKNVRRFIAKGKCFCPLANAYYTNLLLNFNELFKITLMVLRG